MLRPNRLSVRLSRFLPGSLVGLAALLGLLAFTLCTACAGDPMQFPVVELKAQPLLRTSTPLQVAGAGNEYLLVHFRLEAIDPATFKASVKPLGNSSGSQFAWQFYQVCKAAPTGTPSLPADALLPLELGVTATGSAPEFLLTWKIPPKHPKGTYKFEVVFADRARTYRHPLELRVFGFTLDEDLPLTIFGGFWNYQPEFYAPFGIATTAQYLDLVKSCYRSMRQYKINALGGAYFLPLGEVTADKPVEAFQDYHQLVSHALTDLKYRYFMIPKVRQWETALQPNGPFATQAKTFYPLYRDYLMRHGWLGRALNYLIDEPKPAQYPAVFQAFSLARQCAPGIKTLCAGWDPAKEFPQVIDVWATPAGQYQAGQIAGQAAQGQEQWLYANRLHAIDHPAVHQRLIGWLLYRYPFKGYLLWGVNYWPANPWTTPPGAADFWRRGTFYYPHPRNGQPVPTLRLEALRRGLQDYQYLLLLRQAHEKGLVPSLKFTNIQQRVEQLTKDLRTSSFPVQMQELEGLRLEMALLLESPGQAPGPASPSGATRFR